ncbi:bacteriophage abortive infection AbiH family protein [Paenibacillus yanchengensis]|uniref:Bacteriophage abortive infection AbiH family protein n=1 Tax=Paenibacillus yanchengensis TaxID=2035833 RepID=A0ABW4YJD9_9BACL
MTKLFIIGNGFDSAHGLPTKFVDYKNSFNMGDFYYDEDDEKSEIELISRNRTKNDDIGTLDVDDTKRFAFQTLCACATDKDNWSDIEESIAKAPELRFNTEITMTELEGSEIVIAVSTMKEYFDIWIAGINISKSRPKPDFRTLTSDQDLFLTFNYTETLEEVYNIPESQICHIHGKRMTVKGKTIVKGIELGHGEKPRKISDMVTDYYEYVSLKRKAHQSIRKKTSKILYRNRNFFNKIYSNDIIEIYSYGFSFGSVDRYYFEKLFKKLDTTKIVWHFNDHSDFNEMIKHAVILTLCGFKGTFDKYHID